jgi:hypothetical protein
MAAYALTIFLSAFLLFQVQPLIAKYILPWFGGGPGVWTTCMLFFQVVLLAGYGYAHASVRQLRPRGQVVLHCGLLLVSLVLLPIVPADAWKPDGNSDPTLRILVVLGASVGLPYLVLSATSPLMQQWFRRTNPGTANVPGLVRDALHSQDTGAFVGMGADGVRDRLRHLRVPGLECRTKRYPVGPAEGTG